MVVQIPNCLVPRISCIKLHLLQWRNSYYRTFFCPTLHFLVTFYSIYEVKCDQKVEYGSVKSLIVKISPLYLMLGLKWPRRKECSVPGAITFYGSSRHKKISYVMGYPLSFFREGFHLNKLTKSAMCTTG